MGYIGNQSTKIVYTNLDRFKGALANITALNAITGMSSGDMYKLIDSNHAYMYDGTAWVDMGDIQGPIGPRGVGITSIVRTAGNGSEGTTDTYTITYEDTSTSTFDVKNGTAGTIDHITRTTGTGAAGTIDTYTAYADLAETASLGSFDVYNGADGADGTLVSVVGGTGITIDNTDPSNPIINATVDTSTLLSKSGGTMTGAITAIRETKVAMAANNIDLATGNLFTKTITTATTLTISNALANGNVNSFVLELTNGGSAVITWFSGVKWAGGTAPTLTASGKDILGFYSHDGGTTWNILGINKDVK